MIAVTEVAHGSQAVDIAWIGLIGVTITSVVAPIIFFQLKRLQERNDSQHAEASISRDRYNAERHREHVDLIERLARVEIEMRQTAQDTRASRQEVSEITRLFASHTIEELGRYGGIMNALARLIGPEAVLVAEQDAADTEGITSVVSMGRTQPAPEPETEPESDDGQ